MVDSKDGGARLLMPRRDTRDAWELKNKENPKAILSLYCVNGHRVGNVLRFQHGWIKACRTCGAGKPFLFSWEL